MINDQGLIRARSGADPEKKGAVFDQSKVSADKLQVIENTETSWKCHIRHRGMQSSERAFIYCLNRHSKDVWR